MITHKIEDLRTNMMMHNNIDNIVELLSKHKSEGLQEEFQQGRDIDMDIEPEVPQTMED